MKPAKNQQANLLVLSQKLKKTLIKKLVQKSQNKTKISELLYG